MTNRHRIHDFSGAMHQPVDTMCLVEEYADQELMFCFDEEDDLTFQEALNKVPSEKIRRSMTLMVIRILRQTYEYWDGDFDASLDDALETNSECSDEVESFLSWDTPENPISKICRSLMGLSE